MAANVPLTLTVETVGTEGVKRLKDDVAALGKEGANAAPEFQQLSAEIDKLSEQASLTGMMKTLAGEVDVLSAAQTKSATAAQQLGAELDAAKANTVTYADAQRVAKEEVIAAQNALFNLRQELARKKNDTEAAEKEEQAYALAMRDLNSQIIDARDTLRQKTAALRDVKAATTEAANAEREKAAEAVIANREDQKASAALQSKTSLLRDVAEQLKQSGIETSSLSETEYKLINSYKALAGEVAAVQAAQDAQTAMAKRAQQEEDRLALIQIARKQELQAAARQSADEILQDYARMEAAEAKLAEQSRLAGEALNSAFSTVGVRSVATIRAEIDNVRNSMALLASKGGLTGAELATAMGSAERQIAALEKEIRAVTNELTLADKAADLFKGSMGQFAAGNLVAQGVALVAMKVADMGRAFIDAVAQGQQLTRGLNAIYKDATTAASQLDFLRKTASSAGVAVGEISGEFTKFSAAMKFANVPIEQSNALFSNLVKATASLGLSSEEASGSLNALGQMASKGNVQMEELRGQLGDRLPGALGLTAKGMGITEAELVKLVTSGNLAFKDFIVPFTEGLQELGSKSEGLISTWGRLKGALTVVAQSAGDAGWATAMTGALKALMVVIGPVVFLLEAFSEAVGLAGSGVVRLAQALSGNTQAFKGYSDEIAASGQRIRDVGSALSGVIVTHGMHSEAVKTGTAAMVSAADAAGRVDAALRAAAGATGLSAAAATLQANSMLQGASNIIKFNTEAARLIEIQSVATEAATANAKAVKLQGDARVELAKQQSDAMALAKAEAQASTDYAAAMDKVAAEQRAELDILLVQRQRIQEVEAARGTSKDAIDKQTEALANKIVKMQAEAEQSAQAAEKAKAEAASRQLGVELLKDNSKELDHYKVMVTVAQSDVDRLTQAEKDGWATKQQVKDATAQLSRVTALYNDAVGDSIRNIQADTNLRSAHMQVTMAQAQAEASHFEAMAVSARASGNLALATQYEIDAKNAQIRVLQVKMRIDALQNEATRQTLEIQKAEIKSTDTNAEAKRNLIDTELELLKVKQISNATIQDQITKLQAEADALRNGTSQRAGSTSSINGDTSARERNASAIERQNVAMEKQKQLTSDGFEKNADGSAKGSFNSSTANSDLYSLQQKQKAGGLGAGDLATAQAAYQKALDTQTWFDNFRKQNPGAVSFDAVQTTQAALASAKDILDRVTALSKQAATSGGSAGTNVVNINLNGKTSTVNVASSQDASTLAALLQELQSSSTRASN